MASAPGESPPIDPPVVVPPPDVVPPAEPQPPQDEAVPPTVPILPPSNPVSPTIPPVILLPPIVPPPPTPVDPPTPVNPPPTSVDPPPPTPPTKSPPSPANDPSPPPPTDVPPPPDSSTSPPPPENPSPTDSPPPPPLSDLSPPPSPLSPPLPSGSSPLVVSSPPPLAPPSTTKPKNLTTIAVGAAAGSVVLLLAVFGLFWFLCVRKKRRGHPHEKENNKPGALGQSGQSSYPPSGEKYPSSSSGNEGLWSGTSGEYYPSSMQGRVLGSGTIAFTYEELRIATNGFSSVNLLGQGGFGYVHKGMLQNGKPVAVKSLKVGSGQGDREFQAEVETISRVHHKHLVTLVGYCVTDSQKLLVYEFVPNKTMEFHLHGKEQPVMDWPTRLKIAIGAAKGLAYLHEDCHPKIIHRDIKAANILIDHTFEAQVADFGLAKFTSDAQTHVSTRVMGTFGYLAPEYAASGQLSEKSDVFSFGVLLLELVTGRRPVDTSGAQMEDSLVEWARPLFPKALQDGNFDSLVDPRLENNYDSAEMGRMITCAESCVRHSAKRRPKMSAVVRALEGHLALSDLSDGVKPGFSSVYSSSDIDGSSNTGDTMRFRKVFGSEDGASNDFSAPSGR